MNRSTTQKATNFQHEGVAVLHPLGHCPEMNRPDRNETSNNTIRSAITQQLDNEPGDVCGAVQILSAGVQQKERILPE